MPPKQNRLHAKYLSPVRPAKRTDDEEVANSDPTGTADLDDMVARVTAVAKMPPATD